MKRSIAVVYVVGLFLLGIVIGALGMHLYDARHPAFPRRPPGAELGPGPGMWRDGAVDWLSQHLELTPEQKDQIVDILHESRAGAHALHQEMLPRVEEHIQATRERIEQTLTPQQREKLDEVLSHHRGGFERLFLHGPGGHRPRRGKR
jgi:Spy/CpxP family protein refolding chaperone